MPQMAPLWWTSLFSTFILSFIMMWIVMYYQNTMTASLKQDTKMKKMNLNWKW
uniref:ATP synthase complex subunit 8 n=1 Tax=Reduvius tenebrosus TaxID=1347737 RepID=A0A342CF76_9HEMI|nr:ATP synthase F0 subunit 8 [Reduvius tenebrosus]AGO28016.1 ATP synthase F0 subunit 8 [Reduvius tenebrosus]